KHSLGRLYPAAPQAEAKTWQWTLWAANELERSVNLWSLHAIRLPPGDRDPQRLAEAINAVTPRFQVLDGALGDRPYLLGEDFPVADLNGAGGVSRGRDMDLWGTRRMGDWLRRCMERPAAAEARRLRDESDAKSPPDVIRMIARTARV